MADKAVKKHLKSVRRQLYKNLIKSYQGWFYWHLIMRKYKKKGLSKVAVILMPSKDKSSNYLALRYLDQMLEKRGFEKALILAHCETVIKSVGLFSNKVLDVKYFSREKAEKLMQFYCLYNFDNRFIVASLDEPYGRNGSALIGKKGTTAEEIFVIGVYRIYPYTQLPPPPYNGIDKDVEAFLQQGIV